MYFLNYNYLFICAIFGLFSAATLDAVECRYNKLGRFAVVVRPVIDAVPFDFNKFSKFGSVISLYKRLPYAPDKDVYACPRLHQLLFNELVEVVRERGAVVECKALTFFYHDDQQRAARTIFLLKDSLVYLQDIKSSNLYAIPDPYVLSPTEKSRKKIYTKNILTLTQPWTDTKTGYTFSVGTRFVRKRAKDTSRTYAVYIFNGNNHKIFTVYIPKNKANVIYPKTHYQATKLCVATLRKWIPKHTNYVVPYVWGGSSFTQSVQKNNAYRTQKKLFGKKVAFWTRPTHQYPTTGLECSSLILRLTQIFGMPYFYKNTTALSKHLYSLGAQESLEVGDLIWYPGHVLMITDLKNNLVAEAVGYQFGYGCLHEIKLSHVFKQITDYNMLKEYYLKQKPIERLDSSGGIARRIPAFKLLKLRTVWQ